MATKKQKQKTVKKVAKQVKKQKTGIKVLIIIILLAIVGLGGYFGFTGYKEVQGIVQEISDYEINIPDQTTENLVLPTKIGDQITISWTTSSEIITPTGIVTRPSYNQKDTYVTLTAEFSISYKNFLAPMLESMVMKDELSIKTFKIKVLKNEATPEEIALEVLKKIYLPSETYSSILLPSVCYLDGATIIWQSDENTILSSNGVVNTPADDTLVTLRATIAYQGITMDKDYNVLVKSEETELLIIDDYFDNLSATSRYSDIKMSEYITYINGRIIQDKDNPSSDDTDTNPTYPSYIKLRKDSGTGEDIKSGGFIIDNIINPNILKFDYMFSGTQASETSYLDIKIEYMKAGQSGVYTEEVNVKHYSDYKTYELDLSDYDTVKITIIHVWPTSGECFINIDNVSLSTKISDNNLESWVINNTPTTTASSLMLPTTTMYGGSITWSSSNQSIISDLGYVNQPNEMIFVTMTATIAYQGIIHIVTIEIKINGLLSSTPLEIYFIDIGKYGSSDCGESIYIKYGNIDIIVDAGDHFDSTKQAIEETINQHLEDGVIDYVIATHPDSDHIGGMANLFAKYEVANLIKFEGEKDSQKFKNMKDAYVAEGCNIYQIHSDIISKNKQDKFIVLDTEIYISFIDTTYYLSDESNGKSIVFMLEAYGTRILMTGDADNGSGHTNLEKNYMSTVGDVDILKVVHHGTANGTDPLFLNAIKPEVAIICNGNYLGNKHGHPTPKAVGNLYNYSSSIKVYAICGGGTVDGQKQASGTYVCSSEDRFNQRNGTITLLVDNNGYSFTSEYYGDNIFELGNTIYWQAIKNLGLA